MILIAAVDINWALGSNDKLLFYIRSDLKRFKELTTGKVIICGRKTVQTFPGSRPLKNRHNIILSRQTDFTADGADICHNSDELFQKISVLEEKENLKPDIYVVGGTSIYEMLLPYCEQALITYIFDCGQNPDSFLTNLDNLENWKLVEKSDIVEEDGLMFEYRTYLNTETESWPV